MLVGKFFCATTKNRPIGKIEYIATVDRLDSYQIERINRQLLDLAIYQTISLSFSDVAI